MVSDLTSSFSNSSGAMIGDFVLVSTDKYSKDYIDDYDLSGVASVGYIKQEQAVVTKSDAYKVLVCAGEGTDCTYNIFNKAKGKEIWNGVVEGATAQDIYAFLVDKENRYGETYSETDSTASLAKNNKALLYYDGTKVTNANGNTIKLKDVINNGVEVMKNKEYVRIWDKADKVSVLPGAVAYANTNGYSCVVYYTFRVDSGKCGPSLMFYGPNAESLMELSKALCKDYGESLSGLESVDGSKANDNYNAELSKAANKLNMNIIIVNMCTISSATSKIATQIEEGKPCYWFTDEDKKELRLSLSDLNSYRKGDDSIYSQMGNLLDTLIRNAYEGILPAAEDITGDPTSKPTCPHKEYTDLVELINEHLEGYINSETFNDIKLAPDISVIPTTMFIPKSKGQTLYLKYEDGKLTKPIGGKLPKGEKCEKCGFILFSVEEDTTYTVKYTYGKYTFKITINIKPSENQ